MNRLFFLIPVLLVLSLAVSTEAFAEPIKIKHQRGGEIWDLYGNATLVYQSSAPYVFNDATIYADGDNTWVSIDADDLGSGDFDILSGRIGTKFIGSTITHYNIKTGVSVGTEKINLLRLNTVFENIPLTFVSRTLSESFDDVAQNVRGIDVTDTIHSVTITETLSSVFGNLVVDYLFVEGQPLKHTFTFTQTSGGSETYQLHHEFNLITEEIEIESKGGTSNDIQEIKLKVKQDEIKLKIKFINGTEIEEEPETFLIIDKSTFDEILSVVEFNTDTPASELVLGEIVAPSTSHPAWDDFIELFIDATSDPVFVFRYGNYTITQSQSFQLDPDTYSSSNPSQDANINAGASTNSVCDNGTYAEQDTSTGLMGVSKQRSDVSGDCRVGFAQWDTSSIADGSDVTDTDFRFQILSTLNPETCDYVQVDTEPIPASAETIWDDIVTDNDDYVSNSTICNSSGTNKLVDLTGTADTDVENQLADDWFAVGTKNTSMVRTGLFAHSMRHCNEEHGSCSGNPTLEITYTPPVPVYKVDLLDVYESSSTTLGSGTAVCLNVNLESASSCSTALNAGSTYRFEIEVDNTGTGAGSPDLAEFRDAIAASDVLGTIVVGDILNSGCSTNTNWVESIVSDDVRIVDGTTCSISPAGNVEYWFIITLDDDADNGTATFYITDGTVNDVSTTTTFTVNTPPAYVVDLLDVYESSSTTLDSGTSVCLNIDLEIADTCDGNLKQDSTFRFEIEVDNVGEQAGSPDLAEFRDVVAASDVLGTIIAADILNSGCSTNTNWIESIVSNDARIIDGTTCSISAGGSVEYWFIITLDSDADDGTGTFHITDGTLSDTSTTTTFTVLPNLPPIIVADTWTFVENQSIDFLPAIPTGLVVTPTTASETSSLDVDWFDNPAVDNITGFRIFMETPVGGGWTLEVNDTESTTSFYVDTSLSSKTQYNYMIASINGTGVSANSTAANSFTWGVPDAVTAFTIINPTVSTLTLNYTAAVTYGVPVTGHALERESPTGGGFTLLSSDIENVTSYLDTDLTLAQEYNYRVTPLSSLGNGDTNTASGSTVSLAPTSLVVLPDGQSTSNLNMTWVAPIPSTTINGYQIERENPVGGGFSIIVANTSSTAVIHQDTGLVIDTFYNYRVSALTFGGGISVPSNTYSQTTFHLPDSVDDLIATSSTLIDIILTWTTPDKLYGFIIGYQINQTTPQGDPLTILVPDTMNSQTSFIVTNLDPTAVYSHRVSAITIHGLNATFSNIANATATSAFVVGEITLPTVSNPNTIPIAFALITVDSDTKDLQVTYDAAMDLDCTFAYKFSRTNQTFSDLTENPLTGSEVFTNFTINDPNNEIITVSCIDVLDSSNTGEYLITQDSSIMPFLTQATSFQSGAFGTSGQFGAFDLITLLVVIVSMIGFNRVNPAVGVILMVAMIGALSFYGIIGSWTVVLSGIALIAMLAIITVKKT